MPLIRFGKLKERVVGGNINFLKSPMVISFALIAIALSVVAYLGLATAGRMDAVQSDWDNYKADEGSKGFYLSQIRRSLGYGGLIHQFKNFVLRHDPAEAADVREHLSALQIALDGFRFTTTVEAELAALGEISAIANSYVKNLAIAEQLISEGKGPAEIDAEVRIDDRPALVALALLEDNWRKAGAKARDASAKALEQTQLQFLVTAGALGIILFAGVALLAFVRRDAIEKNRAQEALREIQAQYRSIVDTTTQGFWRIDKDLKIVDVNEAMCRMLGYSRDEILGKRPFDFVDESENPELKRLIQKDIRSRVVARVLECRFRRKDGSPLDVHISATNFVNSEGNPSGRFAFMTDLTEQKKRDAQLQHAQKMEAVGQLTGGIAHEFNNLLMVVLGNIETMESKMEKDDPLRSYTASAMKGALRGAELTQSLLAFSRKQRLETSQTDLNRLVGGMQNLYQRTLGEAITIETDLAKDLWLTSADAGQIEAALLNFVLNARDAMPNGGTITVRTSNLTISADQTAPDEDFEPGEYVTLEVSDTGTGMTEEELGHAFEPFYSTKEVGKGTGLGLSVAYGFAKQSGGCLELESKPGRGTTVRLILPRADEAEPRAESEPEAPAESASGSGRILVLEDDAEVRQLVSAQLTELGYEVFGAADGPAGLLILDEHPDIDLLFCDVVLPGGMSGPQTADKAQVGHPDLKVLFTSGYPEKDVENLRVGDRDIPVLSKPYRKAELAEAVAAAMNPS